MFRKIIMYKIYMLVALTFFNATLLTYGQGKENRLNDKIITIKMKNESLGKVLGHLIFHYDISFGFEESDLDRHHSDYAFDTLLMYKLKIATKYKKGNFTNTSSIVESIGFEQVFETKTHRFNLDIKNGKLN